ncbi:MAG: TfoX/Sxy family DNA transformation protein, partial [Raoultibacter sp.]
MNTMKPKKVRRTYFIDSENHINTCLQGIESLSEDDLVLVFHRENNLSQKQKSSIKDSKAQVEWILCQDSGVKNSLDVQLIAELSRRIACHEIENGYIISQDQGYRPAIHYLLNRYADDFRFIGLKRSIDEFMLTDALISSESRQDVHEALARYAGQIIGTSMYRHIREVFDGTLAADEPEGGFAVEGVSALGELTAGLTLGSEESAPAVERVAKEAPEAGGSSNARRQSRRRKPRSGAKQETSLAITPVVETDASTLGNAETTPQSGSTFVREDSEQGSEGSASTASPSVAVRPGQNSPVSARKRSKAATVSNASAPSPAIEQQSKPAAPKSKAPKATAALPKIDKQLNLTSLPNIGLALAKRLEANGVTTPDALRETGSREAWKLLKAQSGAASVSWLYALEGAIRGVTSKDLDEGTRAELKAF